MISPSAYRLDTLLNLFSVNSLLSNFSKEFYHWFAVSDNEAQRPQLGRGVIFYEFINKKSKQVAFKHSL